MKKFRAQRKNETKRKNDFNYYLRLMPNTLRLVPTSLPLVPTNRRPVPTSTKIPKIQNCIFENSGKLKKHPFVIVNLN